MHKIQQLRGSFNNRVQKNLEKLKYNAIAGALKGTSGDKYY